MNKAHKVLIKMKQAPKNNWSPKDIKTLCLAYGLRLRQKGTSHGVLTNKKGEHLTIPMHKPIKPIYIKKLIKLIEDDEI